MQQLASLSAWSNGPDSSPSQLDRSNLANAYVSGMKEDLGFQGDQLNQINTCFTVG